MSGLIGMGIKLFGKTIPFAPKQQVEVPFAVKTCSGTAAATACIECYDHRNTSAFPKNQTPKEQEKQEEKRETSAKEITDNKQEDTTTNQIHGDSKDSTSSDTSENPRTLSAEREISSPKSPSDEEPSQKSASPVKTLKKPDKILACPRCNSMETKFCYYNNYNVNQPRHFCKKCQRYWTAGGTMRNVPVGAGRRKNKTPSVLHYNNIMVREALRTAQILAMDGAQSVSLGNYNSVLTFGSDFPLSEFGSSVFNNLSDNAQNSMGNSHNGTRQTIVDPCGGSADNGDDRSSGSSITAASTASDKVGNGSLTKNLQGFPCNNISWFPAPPLSYPWNPAMPSPAFCPSNFPVPFYPESNCWTCTVPSPWNVKTYLPQSSSSVNHITQIPSPTSPLGKHSRDGNLLNPDLKKGRNSSEKWNQAPKTLRIDDPIEAAKSSLWETVRLKGENNHSFTGIGLFEGFKSKTESRNYMTGTSTSVLQSNPAAMSRSLNFHENLM